MSRASSLFVVSAAGAVVLAACGGAAEAPAKAPAAKTPAAEEREPTSVAEAQDQIERARAELSGADKETAGDLDLARPKSDAEKKPSADTSSSSVREERAAGAADSCASSCRALSSMRRAVSALCRMTGDEDARCSDAKKTLGESESRVARCHCAP